MRDKNIRGINMIKKISLLAAILFIAGCGQPEKRYTVVQENTKDGVIDNSGYVVVKPVYKHIFNFVGDGKKFDHEHLINLHWIENKDSEAYAIVENIDGKYGAINQKGDILLKPIYDSISYFFDGYARIEVSGKYGLINRDFKIVLKPKFDYIQEFTNDVAIIMQNNRYGCLNKDMELKIKPNYDRIYLQQENFLRTYMDNRWGYLDDQCNILVKPIYDYGYDFSNGSAKVIIDGRVGYINQDGKLISKPIFTQNSGTF